MDFRIADTFTDSLARLTGDEQKAVKTTAFDLQMDPANPGMSFHKLDGARDKNFWSVRVSADIRIIVHRTAGSLMLCYVDHHDRAYDWASRRKLETHPKTGAAQLVEIRETVREIITPVYGIRESTAPAKPVLFARIPDEQLLSYGVPPEWLGDVKQADEDSLLEIADHLPAEASEALLELATGGTPRVPQKPQAVLPPETVALIELPNPFNHPDALRRFRVMESVEELERALNFPWDKWTVFLHPEQRQLVERDYSGPARVSGSAGTGKTIVALHRAVHLAKTHPEVRVLLATFSDTLAHALHTKLRRLIGSEPRLAERIDVYSLDAFGLRLYKATIGPVKIASSDDIRDLMRSVSNSVGQHKFTLAFLLTEWEHVVDAWQLENLDAYRNVTRLGRSTRLPDAARESLWKIFDGIRAELNRKKLLTLSSMFSSMVKIYSGGERSPYEFMVVDEAQDISIAQLRFLGALGNARPNALFFTGDLGQRIFQQPFSWKMLGVDVQGRSRVLRINYRTSHQIRQQADRLLGPEIHDIDGNTEIRSETISVFNGPLPEIYSLPNETEEIQLVSSWLADKFKAGILPHELGVFVRSSKQLERARAAVAKSGLIGKVLDEHVETTSGNISICTMPLAKGLEFRAVVVMACDDEVIPLQERIEAVGDEADLEEIYNTERHLLYVACTRARDHLLITGVEPCSEFLDDLRAAGHSIFKSH